MADPRRTSTRRAVLSYSHLKELTKWPDLMLKDYQGILQDFVFTTDELDAIDVRITKNEEDIVQLDIRVTENEEDIIDLQLRVAALEYRAYKIVNTTVDITTNAFETIICKNTSAIDITLKPDAVENDEVNIKRRGATVNVIGTIDGLTNITLNASLYSMKLVFDGTEWNEI